MIVSGILAVGFLGFHHHKPKVIDPQPVVIITPTPSDYTVSSDLQSLEQAQQDYPWLKSWIDPSVNLARKLITETGSEPGYEEDLELLNSDMELLTRLEQNDTI